MKIYLITPKNPESFWTFDRILPTLGKPCLFPNLSLPTVAGLTPREHDVVLCDENIERVDFETDADIVGLTGYVIHKDRILALADAFRRRGKFVVIGGPMASVCPEAVRDHVDVVFIDEAEYTWPAFLADYAAGTWKTEYRQDEKPSLHDSPPPRFDLLTPNAYQLMPLQFTRGCPFTCEFCDIIVMYGRRPRAKTVAQVMDELETLRQLGARLVYFVDDNFIGNKKEVKALLSAIIEWQDAHDYPVEFSTEASIDLSHDDELLELMWKAHFTSVFIGIESPRAASLRETKKTQNLRADLVESVRRIQRAGIGVAAGMIVGFDADDETIFEEQFRFTQDADIPVSMTGLLNAIPKTPLYARLQAAGRLVADFRGDQFAFSNIIPLEMSRDAMYEGYATLLRRLYAYRHYRQRVRRHILALRAPVTGRLNLRREDFAVMARMVWTCLIGAPPGRAWLTLSLLAETIVRRPHAVRDALVLSLLHKHLSEYMRATCRQLDAAVAAARRTVPAVASARVPVS